ncbi:Exonuclease GOR [Habropoda laboriosa]|uniref:Exonuclease GOR n=1 Tax=Habropoda laboriosa TaxID=597456 RepID=A0A0L7R5I1_9HYME|nr:PREDICTED: dentin sialophosphoprotein [Habropoda laboriosa]KOC66103.1 Exonuclease GOR [Habropoda laboriosa]
MEDTEARITPGISMSVFVLVSTLFLGGVLLVISYIVSRLSRSNKSTDSTKNATESEKVKFEDSRDSTSGSTATTGSGAGGGKRAKNKKRREAQQEFTHSWMVGALKGHTAPVLDMNFSSNGKFLASCAEDCGLRPEEEVLDPGETDRYAGCKVSRETPSSTKTTTTSATGSKSKSSISSSSTNASGTTPTTSTTSTTSAAGTKEDRAILSRRQRKNRTRAPRDQRRERDDEHEDEQPTQQQRHRRHHHCRQQHYQNSPTRSSEFTGITTSVGRNSGSRRNHSQNDSHHEESKNDSVNGSGGNNGSRKARGILSSQRKELHHLSDAALASLLRRYTLTGEQLTHLGYPVECSYFPGYAVIINHHQHPMGHRARGYHHLDANAREFVPGNNSKSWTMVESEGDSGNCSGSSLESSDLEQESASDSDKSSDIGESSSSADSSSSSSSSSSGSSYQEKSRRDSTPDPYELVVVERRCARCFKNFYINREDGEYLHEERCVYHWGKLRSGLVDGAHGDTWECCRGRENARGCTTARMHVWTGLALGYNGPFDGYVRTRPARTVPKDGNYGVYALDCEMCFTRRGLELAKVTVVGMDGKVVYDTLVKPDAEVIDYNTRFSGINAKDLSRASKTLRDVQKDLTSFVHAETILIGHGLENDLRALRILHTTVIDTCVAFPHFLGYPFRSSLKTLARTVLRREIQVTEHDSVEDARIAVDLMLRRLQHDLL